MYFLNNARIIQSICGILRITSFSQESHFLILWSHRYNQIESLCRPLLSTSKDLTASKDQIISKDDFLYPKKLYHINVLTNSSTLWMLKMKWLKLTSEVNTEVKSKPKQEKPEKRITFIWMYELWSFVP